jgi:hypothetical protein
MLKKLLGVLLTMGVLTWTLAARAEAPAGAVGDKTATPEAQALKFYKAVRDQDYKAMFYLMAFTPKGRATLTTAEQFALDMQKGYESSFKTPAEKETTDRIFRSISEIMIGEPVIAGGKAAIPTSAKITANGRTLVFKGQAHLIRDDDVWKLDLTFTDDTEKATAQRVSELFGAPEKKP